MTGGREELSLFADPVRKISGKRCLSPVKICQHQLKRHQSRRKLNNPILIFSQSNNNNQQHLDGRLLPELQNGLPPPPPLQLRRGADEEDPRVHLLHNRQLPGQPGSRLPPMLPPPPQFLQGVRQPQRSLQGPHERLQPFAGMDRDQTLEAHHADLNDRLEDHNKVEAEVPMYVDVHRPPVPAAEAVRDLRSDVRNPDPAELSEAKLTQTEDDIPTEILDSFNSLDSTSIPWPSQSVESRRDSCGSTYYSSSYTSWTRPEGGHRVSDSCVPNSSILDREPSIKPALNRSRSVRRSKKSSGRIKRDSSADTSKDIDDIEDFELDEGLDELEHDDEEGLHHRHEEGNARSSTLVESPDLAYASMQPSGDEISK